jgi:hypothetical protein
MKRSSWRGIALVSLGLVVAAEVDARADGVPTADSAAEARSQYQLGTQAFHQKRYVEAALHFESAAAYRTNAVTLYTAGLAWDLASKLERAADAYARALDVPGLDAKQTATAKERIAVLERTLGTLGVTGPEGWKVQLDAFTEAPLPARVHGAAGAHVLTVRAPGSPLERKDVVLEVGKVAAMELKEEVAKAPPPQEEPEAPPAAAPVVLAPPPPPPPAFWTTRRAIGTGVGGIGVAALGATILLGLSATSAKEAYDAGPTRASFDHASSLQAWTNVSLVAGVVLLAGGVALVVWPDEPGRERRARAGLAPGALPGSGRGGGALGGTF